MEPHTTASGCRKAKIALSLNVIRGTIILILIKVWLQIYAGVTMVQPIQPITSYEEG